MAQYEPTGPPVALASTQCGWRLCFSLFRCHVHCASRLGFNRRCFGIFQIEVSTFDLCFASPAPCALGIALASYPSPQPRGRLGRGQYRLRLSHQRRDRRPALSQIQRLELLGRGLVPGVPAAPPMPTASNCYDVTWLLQLAHISGARLPCALPRLLGPFHFPALLQGS